MSEKLKVVTLDVSTGKVTKREFTPEEVKAHESDLAKALAKQEAELAVRTSALAKLAALGLTEEEIGAL